MQAIWRIGRGWPRGTRVFLPVVVVIAVAALTAGCGSKNNTPASTAALTTTTAPAVTTVAQKPAPKPIKKIPLSAAPQAKAYIAAHGADVKLVSGYEKDVQTAIAEVVNSPLMSPLQVSTQKAYNNLYKILPRFKGPYKQDALGLNEKEIATQANAIEKSMNTLLNYTAYPTPVTLGEYTDQYQAAVLAWNKAVKAIWTVAKVPNPPTICTTC